MTTPAIAAIQTAARANGLDWRALASIAQRESGLNPAAVGDQGTSFGLFQLHQGGALPKGTAPSLAQNPVWNANFAARQIKALGIGGLPVEQQIAQISRRFERPADPAAEIAAALATYRSRYAGLPATGAPASAPAAASTIPSLSAPQSAPSPFLQAGLDNAASSTQRAYDALAKVSGTPAHVAPPALDLSTLTAPTGAAGALSGAPAPTSDHVVPLRGNAPLPKGLDTQGKKAVALAKTFIGTPYLYGGANPKTGFDCSGLLQYVWAKNGVQIPHNAQAQYNVATHITAKQLQPGDAVFFRDASGIHHVGMYVGGPNRTFIQAPHTGDHVKLSSLNEPYYASQFAGGGRFS